MPAKDELRQLLIGGGPKQELASLFATEPEPVKENDSILSQVGKAVLGTENPFAPPGMGPIEQKAIGKVAGPDVIGSTAGEVGGRAAGFAIGGPVGAAVGGGAGAAIGLGLARLSKGEKVTPQELALEFGLSILPDVAIKGVGTVGRKILGRTRPGREAAEDILGGNLRANAEKFFAPLEKQKAEELFGLVRASGDKLNGNALAGPLQNLTNKQFKIVSQGLLRIKAPPGKSSEALGEGIQAAFETIRKGEDAPGLDLGSLQHIRSQLSKRALNSKDGATQDALFNAVEIIDDAVANGQFLSGGGSRPLLTEARRLYARAKDAEDFATFVNTRGVTSRSKGARGITLNAGKLADALDNPRSKIEKAAVRALNRNPGAKEEVATFLRNVKRINIDTSATDASPILGGIAAIVGAGPASRVRLARVLSDGATKGQITEEAVITLFNMARQEVLSTQTGLQGIVP